MGTRNPYNTLSASRCVGGMLATSVRNGGRIADTIQTAKGRRRLGQLLVDVHEQLVDAGRVSCIASVRRGLGLGCQPRAVFAMKTF